MKWHEQHEAFKKLAIQQGISRLEQLNQALPFGCTVPRPKIDKWLNALLRLPKDFSVQRRYVNRFKLGADPEFIFTKNGERIDARVYGLAQGLAFGMDNNGRLTEIRPYPSRSALNVVASILSALRWLSIIYPTTLESEWQAGAFLLGDGLGGHVHFGRKRPTQAQEVKALDSIDEDLMALGVYPVREVLRRRQGDDRNQHYGMPGDIRPQVHGYEYRSFPSWLDSPELAFLTIVLSKLAVHCPSLVQGYIPLQDKDRYFQRVRNLLSCFKDTDDDARVALGMIARQMPMHLGGDFKKRWGIEALSVKPNKVDFIPSSIKPSEADVVELFDYFTKGNPLKMQVPTPTWQPTTIMEGYASVIAETNTHGAKGLGELVWDIVRHKSLPYTFYNDRHGNNPNNYFSIPKSLADTLPVGWRKLTQYKINVYNGDSHYIYSQEKMRDPAHLPEARRLLLRTILPFWKVSEVKTDSILQWRSCLRISPPAKKFVGKILFGEVGLLPREVR